MPTYVALLRGINVGGKNLIPMARLKACFEAMGFEDVTTYIQSGNVIFRAPATPPARLASRIEAALSRSFKTYPASIVLRSATQLQQIVQAAPEGFGSRPTEFRYDVLFLKEPLTASAVLKVAPTRPGVDRIHAGRGVVYFSRLIRKASQSRLSRLVSMPIYQGMTIRNWNTTTALLKLMKT